MYKELNNENLRVYLLLIGFVCWMWYLFDYWDGSFVNEINIYLIKKLKKKKKDLWNYLWMN